MSAFIVSSSLRAPAVRFASAFVARAPASLARAPTAPARLFTIKAQSDIDPATEKRKLFVGNLPWSLSEQDISDAFGEYGTIEEVKIVLDRETGRSRGFGFVTYEESSAAEEAVENLNGVELAGREIRVSMSQPMSERPRREGFGGGGRGRGGGGYGGGRGGGYGGGGGGGYGGGVRGGGGGGYDNGY